MKASSMVIGGVAGVVLTGAVRWIARRADRAAAAREGHQPSMTALAAEALQRGTLDPPATRRQRESAIPSEDALFRVGDPEVDPLEAAYVGDETPGGDSTTPDQDRVDDIGRAYGVSEADSGELVSAGELLARRDRKKY
jgi:hypothetical protein